MATDLPGWVSAYVGLPYRAGGRTREGVDCFGLVLLILREQFAFRGPDYPGPTWAPNRTQAVAQAAAEFAARFEEVDPDEIAPGDVLMLRLRGYAIHCGIVIAPGWMAHIEEGTLACLERYDSWSWVRRISSIHRQCLTAEPGKRIPVT